jgi:AraC family transcriptional regulator
MDRNDSLQLRSVVGELLTALTSTLNDERDSAKECLTRAAALLQTADQARTTPKSTRGGLAPWQARTVASHVETNLDKPIRSSDLATVARLDPGYFCRVFRVTFGEPPLSYVSRRRIERAQRLMLETDVSLSQIALDCGFADQAHFSRLFRRVAGDTPRAWRRAHADCRVVDLGFEQRDPLVAACTNRDPSGDAALPRGDGLHYRAARSRPESAYGLSISE